MSEYIQTSEISWYERKKLPLTFEQKGMILEDFIGNQMTIQECAERHRVHYSTISKVIELYFKKPMFGVIIQSMV